MLKVTRTNRFKKDYKKALRQGKNIEKLDTVLMKLAGGEKLDVKYKDHSLKGLYKSRRECHIEPDWLLIYKLEEDRIIFERTGSHSELFK